MAVKRGARSKSSRKQKRAPKRTKKAIFWLWFKRLTLFGAAVGLLAVVALTTAVYFAARGMPSYSALMSTESGQTIIVRARDGSEIVSIGPSYGQWLEQDEIPDVMKQAMVSVEDHRFYSHIGVDALGLGRAVYVWATGSGRLGATSTITQQLARNVFLNSNRTFDRKLNEAVLAMALEWNFTKEEILELYLNKVYFGGGA